MKLKFQIPPPSEPKDRTELVRFNSQGHYPEKFVRVTREELEFIKSTDGSMEYYDALDDPALRAWHDGITKDPARLTNVASICEYC